MRNISIRINDIKNIRSAFIELPLEKGVNVIVGNNGSGKSTILQAFSQAFYDHSLKTLGKEDYGSASEVVITVDGLSQNWNASTSWATRKPRSFKMNGMYEGSLFYGSRFNDSRLVDELLNKGTLKSEDIVDADDYIKEKMSYILSGQKGNYENLKRVRNRRIAQKAGLINTPYFTEINNSIVSQYRMSSGECLLLTLLHFVYNAIVRRSLPEDEFILVLIDEIELALHPIAVHRFIDTVEDLVKLHDNLMVVLTSHSPEVIRRIPPKNIYKIENVKGDVSVINPGYPSYVIRDVYKHDGFDTLILVEDVLAKSVVQKVIDKNGLAENKLLHIVPVGGWENVLRLHHDLLLGNVLGVGRTIFSVIDGDVAGIIPPDYTHIRKIFLPIESVEKFLLSVCTNAALHDLKKKIGDKYFTVKSIGELFSEHEAAFGSGSAREGKKFYYRLVKDLESRKILEDVFIERLAEDIISHVDFTKFTTNLQKSVS